MTSDAKTGSITLDTDAIPGFMGAMTMPYQLAKIPTLAASCTPETRSPPTCCRKHPKCILLDQIVVIAQGKPDYKPTVLYNDLAPGEAGAQLRIPQPGMVRLQQCHGKAVLITFIYTRCPLPNFCPLVTHNFAVIDQQLSTDPTLYAKTHLLSVSFDPEHDTPERLRAYGETYIGRTPRETFKHWDFAAPTQQELPKVMQYFDVGATPEKDTINHSLSTS